MSSATPKRVAILRVTLRMDALHQAASALAEARAEEIAAQGEVDRVNQALDVAREQLREAEEATQLEAEEAVAVLLGEESGGDGRPGPPTGISGARAAAVTVRLERRLDTLSRMWVGGADAGPMRPAATAAKRYTSAGFAVTGLGRKLPAERQDCSDPDQSAVTVAGFGCPVACRPRPC